MGFLVRQLILTLTTCLLWGAIVHGLLRMTPVPTKSVTGLQRWSSSPWYTTNDDMPVHRTRNRFCLKATVKGFVESVTMNRWGVFDDAAVNLTATPSFIAITGETGAGKSVFISALEYICGQSTRSIVRRSHPSQPNSMPSDSGVTICFAHDKNYNKVIEKEKKDGKNEGNTPRKDIISRIYDATTRKSSCEINGEKVTMKSLASHLSSTIRFWSTDSINRLDSDEFIFYVDLNIGKKRIPLMKDLHLAYHSWRDSYQRLQKLRRLHERMSDGDERSLLTHYVSEIETFERKLADFLEDLQFDLEHYGWTDTNDNAAGLRAGADGNSGTATPTLTKSEQPRLPAQELLDVLEDCFIDDAEETIRAQATKASPKAPKVHKQPLSGRKSLSFLDGTLTASSADTTSSKTVNFDTAWDVLLGSDAHYREVGKALDEWNRVSPDLHRTGDRAVMSSSKGRSKGSGSSGGVGGSGSGSGSGSGGVGRRSGTDIDDSINLKDAVDMVDDYGEVILHLKTRLKEVGIMNMDVRTLIEDTYEKLQVASEALQDTLASSEKLAKRLPDISSTVESLHLIKSEWEKLGRKHSYHPRGLGKLKKRFRDDLLAMGDISIDLPRQLEEEAMLRLDYAIVASELSQLRYTAAQVLAREVNALLPSLEMKDKRIGVFMSTIVDPSKQAGPIDEALLSDIAQYLVPHGHVTEHGWDSVTLTLQAWNGAETPAATDALLNGMLPSHPVHAAVPADIRATTREIASTTTTTAIATATATASAQDTMTSLAEVLQDRNTLSELEESHVTIEVRNSNDNVASVTTNVDALLLGQNVNKGNSVALRGKTKLGQESAVRIIEEEGGGRGRLGSKRDRNGNSRTVGYGSRAAAHHTGPTVTPISKILSSGECTRLALALETVTFAKPHQQDAFTRSSSTIPPSEADAGSLHAEKFTSAAAVVGDEGCLVFDEIDAHLGGEAAVAVARLLKQQGKVRQIIAVTHNPVIAAAADMHIVVERRRRRSQWTTGNKDLNTGATGMKNVGAAGENTELASVSFLAATAATTDTGSESWANQHQSLFADGLLLDFPQSDIFELSDREARERELARMATGNLQTDAGIELARALLDIDFSHAKQ